MTEMTPDKRQQITSAVRHVFRELKGQLTITEALTQINRFAKSDDEKIANTTVISKKLDADSISVFGARIANLCEQWLKARHPWALAKNMDEKHVRSIQEYFGIYDEQIRKCRASIVGDYICYRYDDDEPTVTPKTDMGSDDTENQKIIISKLSIEYLGEKGVLRVSEILNKRKPHDTEDFICQWDGICFPEGEFFRLVLRDYSQGKRIPHSKTILLKPIQYVEGVPVKDLYGHYLLGMGDRGFMRTRRIYLIRGKRIPKYKSNPVPILELNSKTLSKLRSFDKKFVAMD